MAKKINLQSYPMRFSGVFDLAGLYQCAKAWYPSVNMGVNWEKLYKDKVSGPGIREIEIQMQGFVKLDRYRKWDVDINFRTWDTKFIQVDGREVCQGRIEIRIEGKLELDYENMYSKKVSNFEKSLGKLLEYFVKKDKDFVIKKKCEKDMLQLQNQFKKILQIPV